MLLLLLGFALFGGAYLGYARLLGWLDGLPQLPQEKLVHSTKIIDLPKQSASPTQLRLEDAFGRDCLEKDYSRYPTQLEFRNGESSIVLAAGRFPFDPGSPRVTLVPFSLAVFGKPKPAHLRVPGEVTEISTFHSDKAVLEFDRPINTPQDMSKARLVRMELLSEPDDALPDPRSGLVHVSNNQRSADPDRALVLKSPGPVFYRDLKGLPPAAAAGPDVWTDAAVELVDRSNVPRPYGSGGVPPTTPARGDDLRDGGAVTDILLGRRRPPPTITAVGMRLFFEPEKSPAPGAAPTEKKGGIGGLRRVELNERVLLNLWVDARTTFVGNAEPAGGEPRETKPLTPPPDPPPATAAALGGLFDASQATRRFDRALLQVETLGPFAYDVPNSMARFDVVPQADPNLPNDVQVTRVPPGGGSHTLLSQVLEVEFNGSPAVGGEPRAVSPGVGGGPAFKRLHAWTYTPGRLLTISAAPEQLVAYGYDLVFNQVTNRSVLQGSPLYVVRDRSVLTAGTPAKPARLVLEKAVEPNTGTALTVYGPGDIRLFDPASNDNTLRAEWQTSFTHVKPYTNGQKVDLLTFTDGAAFEDHKSDYWLRGKVLKLWLMGKETTAGAAPKAEGESSQPLPRRVQAVGDVTAHSADIDIEQADHLNVLFSEASPRDASAKAAAAEPGAVAPPVPGGPPAVGSAPAAPAPGAAPAVAAAPPAKPKPPMKVKARVIDTFVLRVPPPPGAMKADPGADGDPAAPGGGVKYELKTARCEGRVAVHQEPAEPDKPRGVDIIGQTLDIRSSPLGSEMTVVGTDDKLAEVHHEGMSILGPRVFLDQIHNRASVAGRGVLQMPSQSGLNGGELKQPQDVVVHWRDNMNFNGAKKTADFAGKVSARQGESWVLCHTMQVVFDRPIYFNQMKKADAPPAPAPGAAPGGEKDGPKIQDVFCYPAPEDAVDDPRETVVVYNEVVRDEKTGAVAKTQRVVAKELELRGQDTPRGERQNNVVAVGRGETRFWQPGEKEAAPAPAAGPRPAAPPGGAKPAEPEMKLTIVTYHDKMVVKDTKVFQEAVFRDSIELIHVPTKDPNVVVDRARLPFGSVFLTCTDTLTASTHRRANGPPVQGMSAVGNAFIRTDEYEGWGDQIDYDGPHIILRGGPNSPARLTGRFKQEGTVGREIRLNRLTNEYNVTGGTGGGFGGK